VKDLRFGANRDRMIDFLCLTCKKIAMTQNSIDNLRMSHSILVLHIFVCIQKAFLGSSRPNKFFSMYFHIRYCAPPSSSGMHLDLGWTRCSLWMVKLYHTINLSGTVHIKRRTKDKHPSSKYKHLFLIIFTFLPANDIIELKCN